MLPKPERGVRGQSLDSRSIYGMGYTDNLYPEAYVGATLWSCPTCRAVKVAFDSRVRAPRASFADCRIRV